jgi:hypothetical protein
VKVVSAAELMNVGFTDSVDHAVSAEAEKLKRRRRLYGDMLAAEDNREWGVRSDQVVWRSEGEDVVVLELETGTYFTLNGSGRVLWLKLAAGCKASELAQQLQDVYGISDDLALADASAFVKDLAERNLLIEKDEFTG